ncbi:NAD(P)-dependent dehydrogenase (Short-subunit alcohol dehydrogenase family) OS=Streptomyces violarus OX=67380 GN=FHS41_000806 PE=4 SV=1 [Streptomyces violarus]
MTVTEDGPQAMDEASGLSYGPGIDPERLAVCLSVLEELDKLEIDHPDAVAVRRAAEGVPARSSSAAARSAGPPRPPTTRRSRRPRRPAPPSASTTRPRALLPSSRTEEGRIAGILQRPRSCYTCKTRYVEVDYFYHQLCPTAPA